MTSLRLDRLFHVLVVLGGASASACDSGEDSSRRDPAPDAAEAPAPDADPAAPDAGPAAPDADPADGAPCFCDSQPCCDRSVSPPVLEDGFTCCWSTTCE